MTYSAAAAVQRMRARPRRPPPPPSLAHQAAPQDRRRIPLEGRRRTAAWWAALEAQLAMERFEEDRRAWYERHRPSLATPTAADVTGIWPNAITITITHYNSTDGTAVSGDGRYELRSAF